MKNVTEKEKKIFCSVFLLLCLSAIASILLMYNQENHMIKKEIIDSFVQRESTDLKYELECKQNSEAGDFLVSV